MCKCNRQFNFTFAISSPKCTFQICYFLDGNNNNNNSGSTVVPVVVVMMLVVVVMVIVIVDVVRVF